MDVQFTDAAMEALKSILSTNTLKFLKGDFEETKKTITDILRADPRSVHFKRKCQDKIYWFHIDELNLAVKFDLQEATKKQVATVQNVTIWQETYDGDAEVMAMGEKDKKAPAAVSSEQQKQQTPKQQ